MSFWQLAYQFGWATKEDLKLAVQLKEITATDYKTILKQMNLDFYLCRH